MADRKFGVSPFAGRPWYYPSLGGRDGDVLAECLMWQEWDKARGILLGNKELVRQAVINIAEIRTLIRLREVKRENKRKEKNG